MPGVAYIACEPVAEYMTGYSYDATLRLARGLFKMRCMYMIELVTYPFSSFLYGFIGVCCSRRMLAEKDGFGRAVVESYNGMFPVSDMVPESDIEHLIPKVEAVKVEPERVHDSLAFINNDKHR